MEVDIWDRVDYFKCRLLGKQFYNIGDIFSLQEKRGFINILFFTNMLTYDKYNNF